MGGYGGAYGWATRLTAGVGLRMTTLGPARLPDCYSLRTLRSLGGCGKLAGKKAAATAVDGLGDICYSPAPRRNAGGAMKRGRLARLVKGGRDAAARLRKTFLNAEPVSRSMLRKLPLVVTAIVLTIVPSFVRAQSQGDLDAIRADVRATPPPSSAKPSSAPASSAPPRLHRPRLRRRRLHRTRRRLPRAKTELHDSDDSAIEKAKGNMFIGGLVVGAVVVAAPCGRRGHCCTTTVPEAHFSQFPYDNTNGYLVSDAWLTDSRPTRFWPKRLAEGTGRPCRRRTGWTATRRNRRKARLSRCRSILRRGDGADSFGPTMPASLRRSDRHRWAVDSWKRPRVGASTRRRSISASDCPAGDCTASVSTT